MELVDRELRAAARAVTGCTASTPCHALMAEAGLPTAGARRTVLSAKILARALALPAGDPLRAVASAPSRPRLSSVSGWRELARGVLDTLGVRDVPMEPALAVTLPPWTSTEGVTVGLFVDQRCGRSAPEELRRAAAEAALADLPLADQALWV